MANTKDQAVAFLAEIGVQGVKGVKEVGTSLTGKFAHIDEAKLHNQKFEQSPHSPSHEPSYFIGLAGELTFDMNKNTFTFMGWKTAPLTTKGISTDVKHKALLPWELPHDHVSNTFNAGQPAVTRKVADDDFRARNNADLSHYGEDYNHEHLVCPIPKGLYEALREFAANPSATPTARRTVLTLMRDLWLIINRKKFAGRMRSPKFQISDVSLKKGVDFDQAHGSWFPSQRIFAMPLKSFVAPVNTLMQTLIHEAAHEYCSEVLKLEKEGHGPNWVRVMHQVGMDVVPVGIDGKDNYLKDTAYQEHTPPSAKKFDLRAELHKFGSIHTAKYGMPVVAIFKGQLRAGRLVDIGSYDAMEELENSGTKQKYIHANMAVAQVILMEEGHRFHTYLVDVLNLHYIENPELEAALKETITDSALCHGGATEYSRGKYGFDDTLKKSPNKTFLIADIINKITGLDRDLGERGLQHPKDFHIEEPYWNAKGYHDSGIF